VTAVRDLVLAVPEDELREYVLSQRWFGSKSAEVASVGTVDAFPLRDGDGPLLAVAVVETRFQPGTHELYNVPLGFRRRVEEWREGVLAEVDGWSAYEALSDPELVRELVAMMRAQQTVELEAGSLEFRTVEGLAEELGALERVRPMVGEQSNSSVVLDEQLVLKLYRKLEAGVNPELEMLRFLTERGFPSIASLEGWASHLGQPLEATLAILQHYVHGRSDGWTLALESLAGDAERFLPRARRLGEVTGSMHSVLASEPADPAFSPEEPGAETLALLIARIDEEIEQLFLTLPDEPALEPLAGRGDELRDRVQAVGQGGPAGGRLIRHHGDYHLGQVLWTENDDWVVLDFEGEPARPLAERRRKRSPLRDVAGMLRSFSYAASASELDLGLPPPADWEIRVRHEFLDAYFGDVDPAILPPPDARERLLALFELEKAVYELRYELGHRPEWAAIPVAAIVRLLEQPL
jgi:trehalose synthase-fused probable maltokinase